MKLKKLTELKLTRTKFKSIESNAFTCFDNVCFLNLSDCQLPLLTEGIFETAGCANLASLDLYNCSLATIGPNVFKGLSKLKRLDIGKLIFILK